jgi:hypothetical protein
LGGASASKVYPQLLHFQVGMAFTSFCIATAGDPGKAAIF